MSRGRATQGFLAVALVKGANEVAVAPRLAGIILEMGPREGQPVAAGDLLARIDTRELEDQIASLEAQYQGAIAEAERKERDADRTRELLAQRSISESQADQQRSDARSARERVNSLKNQIGAERTRLDYARVTAPFAGVIAERLADPGSLAQVGTPLYRLVATDSGRLEVRLPAEVLEQVAPGTEVVLSHRGQTLDLPADRVFPSLDQRALGRLEIEVPKLPFGLAPGALLRARVVTKSADDALLVPVDALLGGSDPERATVFRISAGEPRVLEAVPVTIALRGAAQAAVTGDLAPGDRVVTAHETTLRRLQAGDPVRVAETAP